MLVSVRSLTPAVSHSELKEQSFERVVGIGVASRRRTRKRESLKRPGFELD